MPPSAINASRHLNRTVGYKGVKTRASAVANNLSIEKFTLATIIYRDLPPPILSPKIVLKKGIRPPKLTAAHLLLAANTLALLALTPSALKATPKAAVKGIIGKKLHPRLKPLPLSG